MDLFMLGLAIGAILGTAAFLFVREREIPIPEWEELLEQQERRMAELYAIEQGPRAVTRLTNRERTVEL